MRQDLKNQISLPLILTGIFIITSFIPIIQIFILTLDGGLISIVNKIIGEDKQSNIWIANLLVNSFPTILFLLVFYKAAKKSIKIFASTLAMGFMTVLFFFMTNGEDNNPYFLKFMIISLICGFILTLVTILKYRRFKQIQVLS